MDPFQKLPVEITLSIMENIYSHNAIWRLIQASPTMLNNYLAHKPALLREFISELIQTGNNDDLIQDALGILGFDATKDDDQATRRHFDRYTKKELPNPLDMPESERGHVTIANLHRLFSRLGLFIEDYMGKATASDPVMEYLRHPPEITYTNTKKRVTLDDLSPLERYRLFRAFLKHEVLCKIFDPRLVDLMPWVGWNEQSRASWVHMDSRLYESVHCVYEYIKASFGGLFARLAWAQKRHADDFFKYSKTRGLLYPDTVTVSSLSYFQDLIRTPSYYNVRKWSNCRGLDVLAHLLNHMAKGPCDSPTLLQWFCSIAEESSYNDRDIIWGDFLHNDGILRPRPSEPRGGLASHLLISQINEERDSNTRVEDAGTFSNIPYLPFEHEGVMYRQRAWMFCDSARLYPPIDSHFPARSAFFRYRLEADHQSWIHGPGDRGRRRSVEWQDFYTGRTFGKPPDSNGVVIEEMFPENNVQHVPSFFNSSGEGELSTFWRFERRWE